MPSQYQFRNHMADAAEERWFYRCSRGLEDTRDKCSHESFERVGLMHYGFRFPFIDPVGSEWISRPACRKTSTFTVAG